MQSQQASKETKVTRNFLCSSSYVPLSKQMAAHDELPRAIRDAMQEGSQPWNSIVFLKAYRGMMASNPGKGAVVERALVDHLSKLDREHIARFPQVGQ